MRQAEEAVICETCRKSFVPYPRRKRGHRFCSRGCAAKHEPQLRRLGWNKPGLEPTKHPALSHICWAAGLYEGEGSCAVYGHAKMTQKDSWALQQLRAYFGGSIGRYGQGSGHKYFHWSLSGTMGRGFLMTIYSLLSPRRQEQIRRNLWGNLQKSISMI